MRWCVKSVPPRATGCSTLPLARAWWPTALVRRYNCSVVGLDESPRDARGGFGRSSNADPAGRARPRWFAAKRSPCLSATAISTTSRSPTCPLRRGSRGHPARTGPGRRSPVAASPRSSSCSLPTATMSRSSPGTGWVPASWIDSYQFSPIGKSVGRSAMIKSSPKSQIGCWKEFGSTGVARMRLSVPSATPPGMLSKLSPSRTFQAMMWSVQDVSPLTPSPPRRVPL